MLGVTGLPLMFHDEIDAATGADYEASLAGPPSAKAGRSLDSMVDIALLDRPAAVSLFIAFSQDSPLLTVTTGPGRDAGEEDMTLHFFDRAAGEALGPASEGGIMHFVLTLHTECFWASGPVGHVAAWRDGRAVRPRADFRRRALRALHAPPAIWNALHAAQPPGAGYGPRSY